MKIATLFTGGGGVDTGAETLGWESVFGVEWDDRIAGVARANGFPAVTSDIMDVTADMIPDCDIMHASPVCKNFSAAKVGGEESDFDIATATKTARLIVAKMPRIVTIENVWAYRESTSWGIIQSALHDAGYYVNVSHVNFADYGVPQTRRRMIARAIREGNLPALRPTNEEKPTGIFSLEPWYGWHESVKDLIPSFTPRDLPPYQRSAAIESLPALLTVQGKIKGLHARRPAMTITGTNRTLASYNIVTRGGALSLNSRAVARLCGFPESYKLPPDDLAVLIFGNSVPPIGYANIMRSFL